jgi:hypothetical protein
MIAFTHNTRVHKLVEYVASFRSAKDRISLSPSGTRRSESPVGYRMTWAGLLPGDVTEK